MSPSPLPFSGWTFVVLFCCGTVSQPHPSHPTPFPFLCVVPAFGSCCCWVFVVGGRRRIQTNFSVSLLVMGWLPFCCVDHRQMTADILLSHILPCPTQARLGGGGWVTGLPLEMTLVECRALIALTCIGRNDRHTHLGDIPLPPVPILPAPTPLFPSG